MNFITILLKNGYKTVILLCIQQITKYDLFLLKDLLKPERAKFTNTRRQYQKNVYIDKLDDIVNEYNNTYHRTIRMKPTDVKDNTYY